MLLLAFDRGPSRPARNSGAGGVIVAQGGAFGGFSLYAKDGRPVLFSADETTDVGCDGATPVSDDYGTKDSGFTGRVDWVQIDVDAAAKDVDHLISPEDRLRVAMARQ